MSEVRRLLLDRLLQAEGLGPAEEFGIPRRDGATAALSFGQERLWFLDQLAPNTATYNSALVFRLSGTVRAEDLRGALQTVVDRHETLRASFPVAAGRPDVRIEPGHRIELARQDAEGLGADEVEAAILASVAEPFDLATGPLIRALLIRTAPTAHTLVVTVHHIAFDGWSQSVLVKELTTAYSQLVGGSATVLPPLPIQYGDFAAWQRTQFADGHLDKQIAYWRDHLAGAPALLELPTDHARPAAQTFRGARSAVTIPADLTRRLRDLGRQHDATLFMTLFAGFTLLLSRYSSHTDITVGTPVANRTRTDLEPLIGFFVNTLPIRTRLDDDPTVAQLLDRVRGNALKAYDHQDVPFEKLVEELAPERDLSHSPLFQVLFILQNTPTNEVRLPGLTAEVVDVDPGVAKYDLTLSLKEQGDVISGGIEYSLDLFEPATVTRLTGHYLNLLRALADAGSGTRVSRLPMLSPDEHRRITRDWNAQPAPAPINPGLHQLFEAQADKTPDAIAARHGENRLCYRELDERANRVAWWLIDHGAKPGAMVTLLVDRSLDTLVGLLAILKSGAAYLPLDPSHPQQRLHHILDDARASLALTQTHLRSLLPETTTALALDDDGEVEGRSTERPDARTTARDLAYVIYTSGSTGKPKGVMIEHASIVNHMLASIEMYNATEQDVLPALTTISFDISALEIFMPLSCGATVEIVDEDTAVDGDLLHGLLARSNASIVQATPSGWRQLLASQWPGDPTLRALCGGEALPADLARQLGAKTGRLWNMYGPTEATVWCSSAVVDPDAEREPAIGRPLPGHRLHILDRHGNPTPVGVPGELHIGGLGLARGYHGRPRLTAERFIPDHLSGEPGQRLYRTGDLARYEADGTIRFLGRVDHQIKLRGFRIELGEIEHTLTRHPEVQAAAAVLDQPTPDNARIVAYVATADGSTPATLADHLKTSLPDYMIPAAVVALTAIPLTPNGKLDRAALPEPTFAGGDHTGARDETEQRILDLWSATLGRPAESIGVHDSFFTLGGHSLLAMALLARLREAFPERKIPLRAFFHTPTVAGIAAIVAGAGESPARTGPRRRSEPAGLSFGQDRLWFLDQLAPNTATYHSTVILRLRGKVNVAALRTALQVITDRHETLRTAFAVDDGQPKPRIDGEFRLRLGEHDATRHRADDVAELVKAIATRPFDLATGPLVRAHLIHTAPDAHTLVLTVHHIVFDGWSQTVLINELTALYGHLAGGDDRPIETVLPPLPIQYTDFAAWQRDLFANGQLTDQVRHWREHLAGAPPLLELPTDRPRPHAQTFRGSRAPLTIPPELTNRLRELGRRQDVTLFMVLFAAFNVLLSRFGGRTDITVGTPMANRTRTEFERLIGFFVNTLPIRTRLDDDPTVAELLARVRDTALKAYENQDVPFEKLVEELAPRRSRSYPPLFQVMFILQNTPVTELRLPELTAEMADIDPGVAKYDLTLSLKEQGDAVVGGMEYSQDLFEPATVARLTEHYLNLLHALTAADLDSRVSRLPVDGPTA
ncbi:non-ribosomal peptide synthetase [Kutzneria sp. CA-103260]|uniref:non-ribosomal peptide synthetase n=1 Tax=Kutzneria sp. CA-103260 TaxID=2802641 RepID=UPI001BA60EEE|nr:non-ribosomal peptide synthetase [Kutzneria sp. CA-103260]QUQ67058.1 non-ribosomal peptide synthetase [Kutzneria sp. CA-103260]